MYTQGRGGGQSLHIAIHKDYNDHLNRQKYGPTYAQCYRMVNLRHLKKGNTIGNFHDFKP